MNKRRAKARLKADVVSCFMPHEKLAPFPELTAWRQKGVVVELMNQLPNSELWKVQYRDSSNSAVRLAVYHLDELEPTIAELVYVLKHTAGPIYNDELDRLVAFYKELVKFTSVMGPTWTLAQRDASHDLMRVIDYQKQRNMK